MLRHSAAIAALLALGSNAITAQPAASRETRSLPFMAVAGSAGASGFTGGGAPQAVLGGYGYVALERFILGAQGGGTPEVSPNVLYGMATLGYPARAIGQSLMYPFVGVGRGVTYGGLRPREASAVFGAGVGADRVIADDGFGWLVGLRGGYLYRPGDAGERTVYFSVALGAGGRRQPEDRPPPIIVARSGGGG